MIPSTGAASRPSPKPIEPCTAAPSIDDHERDRETERMQADDGAGRNAGCEHHRSFRRFGVGRGRVGRPLVLGVAAGEVLADLAQLPAQKPGRSAVIWIGRSAGDRRWSTIGRPPAVGCTRGAEQVLDAHPGHAARRPSSRSARTGRSAGRAPTGASSSSSAPSGHGSCERSTIARSTRSRSARPVAPAGTARATRRARRSARRCSSRATGRRRCGAGSSTRSRSEIDAADQPSTASPVARTRSSSAAVVASPGAGGRTVSPRRIAPSRRSTRSTRSSRPGPTPAARSRRSRRPARRRCRRRRPRRRAGSASGRACRRGRRRRRTARGRADRCRAARRRVPDAELELTGPAARGQPVGERVQQQRRRRGRHRSGRCRTGCPTGGRGRRRGRAGAAPLGGRPGRGGRGRPPAGPAARGRPAARRSGRAARRARRRPRRSRTRAAPGSATSIRASRGCTGSPSIARPTRGDAPVAVERAERVQQLGRGPHRLGRRRGR